MNSKFNPIIFICFLLYGVNSLLAADYIAVGKDGKVFDDASPKYVTLNENNEEVIIRPGMVFKTTEKLPGWYLIEYSPGLRGYIQEQVITNMLNNPSAGTYQIQNDPQHKISVQNSNGNWSATSGGKSYNGFISDNIVVFMDENGVQSFSLIDYGAGGVVMSYDNSVTKFF
ncbi:MAG: hypothetical protein J1E95_07955 [Muribaculaceae bacterium]|nr:hypothetical protein [Muribaculaceae bacterium]